MITVVSNLSIANSKLNEYKNKLYTSQCYFLSLLRYQLVKTTSFPPVIITEKNYVCYLDFS